MFPLKRLCQASRRKRREKGVTLRRGTKREIFHILKVGQRLWSSWEELGPCTVSRSCEQKVVRTRLIRDGGLYAAYRTGLQLWASQRFLAQKQSSKTS